jgi:DNA polymerase I-like protein with 3'-5' exonuclease and polymerase domains
VWDNDGSQLEFRVAGDLGHDHVALEEITNYVDIHSITAKALTEAGEPTDRQEAKSRTFRPLYGGTSGTSAEQEYCKFFQNKYKGIYETQKGWTYEVLKTGQLRTPYGMLFYWPGTKISRSGFISNTTAIFNYPVQGFATGEIIPIALFCLWHRLRGWQVRFTLTIHDSIVLEVGPGVDKEKLKELIAKAFTEDVYDYLEKCYGYKFVVPLGCGIKAGPRWGEGKEIQAQMFNSDRKILWREKK